MEIKTNYLYSDASFSKSHGIAVVGYVQFPSIEAHSSILISDMELKFEIIKEKNNIRAEIKAAMSALGTCLKSERVILYSDCRAVCDLPKRREKLENAKYISRIQGKPLSNSDLYKKFYRLADQFELEIFWIKGHSIGNNKVEKNFSYLDNQVRKKLRRAAEQLDASSKL